MPYLIYDTKEAAIERADEEGKELGFSYWVSGVGTRWLSQPVETEDNQWALSVDGYSLDESEESSVVDYYIPVISADSTSSTDIYAKERD
jgi:hypothetical protein